MPGWHEKTSELRARGELQLVGIIQEQHPRRCALFMQWKRMGWPILIDSLNRLELRAVPVPMLVDEHGVVRKVRARHADVEPFLDTMYEAPQAARRPVSPADPESLRGKLDSDGSDPELWRELGDALFLGAESAALDDCVAAYRKALELEDAAATWFRLGVALRRRYESEHRRAGDFQAALDAWGEALSRDPNQYIWRRRIQQYGPRLEKPYAFYDWVETAREAIEARGETPVELRVEPRGAELAGPAKRFAVEKGARDEPDPEGKIRRDRHPLVDIEVAVAPRRLGPGDSARVHVVLRPSRRHRAHWNNEAGVGRVWIDTSVLRVDRKLHALESGQDAVSGEPRRIEFEAQLPETFSATGRDSSSLEIPGYALYYVCEDVDGVCQYLRQDFTVTIDLARD